MPKDSDNVKTTVRITRPIHAFFKRFTDDKPNSDPVESQSTPIRLDGGARAFFILAGSFLCNGILFGLINTYSVVYAELQKELEAAGVEDASTKAALVGSLTIGTTFLLSPISGILTDRIGIRRTCLIGAVIASTGMLLSAMFHHQVEVLYVTYGIMYGLGASLVYTPSLAILGHYFDKYLGLVNGIVSAGSSVFTIITPFVLERLIRSLGLKKVFVFNSVLLLSLSLAALLFRPVETIPKDPKRSVCDWRSIINMDNWKNRKYLVWVVAMPTALFGYFVPYVHIIKLVEINFPGADGTLPVMCKGVSSCFGRLIFGYFADSPKVNRIFLQQLSFVVIGVLTALMPFTTDFYQLLLITLGLGFFDGCFISILGPIAYDMCGKKGAAQGIGFLLGMCAFPLTIGPPIAGMLYDHLQSYTLAFVLSGIPGLTGALLMTFIYFIGNEKSAK